MNPPSIATEPSWVPAPGGRLFVQSWQPEDPVDPAADPPCPVVLLHDSLGCVALWRDFPARLAAATRRRVIAYDRLGFGRSDPRGGTMPPDFVASEAREGFAAVRAALGLSRFAVFGHSVGGGMAVHVAAAAGAACEALVTESAQAFVEERTRAGIRDAQAGFADPAQRERLARYHGDKAAWVLSAWIDTWLSPAFGGWSLDDALPRVRCPALVIHGEEDEFGTSAHPRRIVAGLGGPATLALLPGLRHVPHREDEDGVVARVAAWLRRLDEA